MESEAKKPTIVLFPGPGMGHITPMVELAKLFITHNFSITILILDSPFDPSSAIAPYTSRVSSACPSISFHHLPKFTVPPRPNSNPILSLFHVVCLSTPHISNILKPLSQTVNVCALVLGFFCTDALDVAAELNIPSYFLFATSALNVAAFLSCARWKRARFATSR